MLELSLFVLLWLAGTGGAVALLLHAGLDASRRRGNR
jgi:hypothetical protein